MGTTEATDPGGVAPQTDSSNRPKRTRNAPKRFEDEVNTSPTPPKPVKKRAKVTSLSPLNKMLSAEERAVAARAKLRNNANYTTKHLMTSKASFLAKIDLVKLLTDDRAWEVLSAEQKTKILRLLPNAPPHTPESVDKDIPSLAKKLLNQNSAFKSDVRRFQDDLINGYFDPRWQAKARLAMEERARGDFDEWKEQETELWWGQKMK